MKDDGFCGDKNINSDVDMKRVITESQLRNIITESFHNILQENTDIGKEIERDINKSCNIAESLHDLVYMTYMNILKYNNVHPRGIEYSCKDVDSLLKICDALRDSVETLYTSWHNETKFDNFREIKTN